MVLGGLGFKSSWGDPESCRGNPWVAVRWYVVIPVVAVLDEWRPPREYGELTDTPKAVAEILAVITVGKRS